MSPECGIPQKPKCHPGRKRVSAGEPGAMDLRIPMPGNGSRIALPPSPHGFGVTSLEIGCLRQPMWFPWLVAVLLGQGRRRCVGVPITERAAGSHPDDVREVRHEHRECAQHRLHPKMDRRRGSTPVCVHKCSGHDAHYAAAPSPAGKVHARFLNLFLQRWNRCGVYWRGALKVWVR